MSLSIQLQKRIEKYLTNHDLAVLFKEYSWDKDNWDNGFADMRQLEIDLLMAAKHEYLTKTHIMSVARWGRLRNPKRVSCPELMRITLYEGGNLSEFLTLPPSSALKQLRENIKGMGPTYFSKILMFSRPQLYGAIDTRLVRVFGLGDPSNEEFRWLKLKVQNYSNGWHIPEYQSAWPSEYDMWIEILHHIANIYNKSGHKCPHQDEYVSIGLRKRGIWTAADVETALFSFASKRLQGLL